MMSHIFISYKRQDKDVVFPIVEDIKKKTGVDCWIDLEGIESGDQFQNVIIDAIDNADIVIFMLSKNFIAPYRDEISGEIDLKKQTFPEKEVMYALRHNKRLIPISIDGTTVYDCKWLEFNCSGLDCINWGVKELQSKLLNNLRHWTGNKQITNAIQNTHHSSGTILVESNPGYACLNINVNETCKIYRFGKQIGEVKSGAWGEIYLRIGKHELSFVSEKNQTVTKVIEIPSADFTSFIHIEFAENNEGEKYTNKVLSSTEKKQRISFSINTLRKNKGCSIALTVAFVLCVVVFGYLIFEGKEDAIIIAVNTNDHTTAEYVPSTSNPSFTGRPNDYEGGVTATPPMDEIVFVDLGLPSGTLWAERNIGANTPDACGIYYSWGEVEQKSGYYEHTYTKPHISNIASTEYDVVSTLIGGKAKLPSYTHFNELIKECKWEWTDNNNVSGYSIIGTNGNKIFLPAAGRYLSSVLEYKDQYGYYWAAEVYPGKSSKCAYGLSFGRGYIKVIDGYLYSGRTIRAIKTND